MEKYKDLEIEKKLLDITEQIASEYSNIVYTSVKLRKGSTLNMFFLRGYVLEESGVWYQNAINSTSLNRKNENESAVFRNYENDPKFFLYKKLELTDIYKFPVS